MIPKPLVSIQVVVHNGYDYIGHCLRTAYAQTYENFEVTVLDNASTDDTREIVRKEFPQARLIAGGKNLGMWPGQEYLLGHTTGEYVLALSVDVMLDKDFLKHAVEAFRSNEKVGAVQGKLYQYEKSQLTDARYEYETNRLIDTCGFSISKGRKIINIAHGERDNSKHSVPRSIFAVEGAAPVFRRRALEDIRVENHIADPDYFWYGDDLDIGWRMRLFGWDEIFVPAAVAWHDRSTTKSAARSWHKVLRQVFLRRRIPLQKRRLDWSNVRFTIIKNDYILNILKDAPWIIAREAAVFFYTLLFEPAVFLEVGRFFRLLPRMLRRRRLVMAQARTGPKEMRRWFQ